MIWTLLLARDLWIVVLITPLDNAGKSLLPFPTARDLTERCKNRIIICLKS
uniref:Uncharacterized protein n=1 Tax=Amphimedon queenslandica TaxID=400682 RepID=A0A1X7U6G3_AMPQE